MQESRLVDCREDGVQPQDLPLLLASQVVSASNSTYPLDRIRMQKAVFLVTHSGNPSWGSLYAFTPYNWGPYSPDLTRDVTNLCVRNELAAVDFPSSQYASYRTTVAGERRAIETWRGLDEQDQSFVRRVRDYVTSKSFQKLLREVYAAFPDYATASRFQG